MNHSTLFILSLALLPCTAFTQLLDGPPTREYLEKTARKNTAERLGFRHTMDGVAEMVDMLRLGVTLEQAKEYLVSQSGRDQFTVDGTSAKYIFYRLEEYGKAPLHIAILRKRGELYLEGSELKHPYYRVMGVDSMLTASGGEVDIVVFEGLE